MSWNDPIFYTTISFCVYCEDRLSGFAFIRKTVYRLSCIVKTVYQVLRLSCVLSYRACVSYHIVRLSYPIVRVTYSIVYHVKVNVAGTATIISIYLGNWRLLFKNISFIYLYILSLISLTPGRLFKLYKHEEGVSRGIYPHEDIFLLVDIKHNDEGYWKYTIRIIFVCIAKKVVHYLYFVRQDIPTLIATTPY